MTEAADVERVRKEKESLRFYAEGDAKKPPALLFHVAGKTATERLLKFLRAWK